MQIKGKGRIVPKDKPYECKVPEKSKSYQTMIANLMTFNKMLIADSKTTIKQSALLLREGIFLFDQSSLTSQKLSKLQRQVEISQKQQAQVQTLKKQKVLPQPKPTSVKKKRQASVNEKSKKIEQIKDVEQQKKVQNAISIQKIVAQIEQQGGKTNQNEQKIEEQKKYDSQNSEKQKIKEQSQNQQNDEKQQ